MSLSLSVAGPRRVDLVATTVHEPGDEEVLLAVRRCGICGSDLHWYTGHQTPPTVCPGHEISAEVERVGPGVHGWREGARVAVEPLLRCGRCTRCRAGDYHLCRELGIHGVTHAGGMAERLVVHARTLHRLPDNVDFDLGALAEPVAVAVHALRLAHLERGDRVAVLGSGTIGLVTIAAARHLGAAFVAATGRYEHQRRLAAVLGADQVLAPDELAALAERPRIVIETVGGRATTVADGVRCVRKGGVVVMLGLFDEAPKFDPMLMLVKEARLVGSNVYNRPAGARADFEIALDILADRGEQLRRLITHTTPLRDAAHAFAIAGDKASGAVKVLLDPTG